MREVDAPLGVARREPADRSRRDDGVEGIVLEAVAFGGLVEVDVFVGHALFPSRDCRRSEANPESLRGDSLDCSHGDLVCQDGWSALCLIAGQLFVPTVGPFGWNAQVRSRPAR